MQQSNSVVNDSDCVHALITKRVVATLVASTIILLGLAAWFFPT